MIHKSKKLLTHCLAPVSRNLAFRFCSKPLDEDLQILEGKAFLSYRIIKEIENPQFNVEQKSLRQHLVDLIESKTEVPSPSREFMKSMFTTGIEIDEEVFNQPRILKAIKKNPQQKKMFIFCPTRLVTTQMFDSIQNNQYSNTLFMGHYGISKSISVMLYTILSNFIAEYKFKTYGQIPSPLAAQIGDSPKVVYYNLQQGFEFQKITQSILKQCQTQIGTENEYYIFNFSQQHRYKSVYLKTPYEDKNIDVILFLDQISKIVGVQKRQIEQQEKQITKKYINSFRSIIDILSSQFVLMHYLSPLEISLDQIKQRFYFLGSQTGHEILKIRQIPYLQNLLIKDTAYEIIDFYLFQVQRNFKIPLLSKDFHLTSEQVPEKYKKYIPANSPTINLHSLLRNYLTSKLIETEGYIVTFYSISLALSKITNKKRNKFQTLESVQHIDKLIEMLEDQLDFVIEASHQQVSERFNRFLNEQQQFNYLADYKRSIIVSQLYQKASSLKGSADKKNLYLIVAESYSLRTTLAEIVRYADKNLFKFDKHGLKTYVPPKLLMQILQPYVEQELVEEERKKGK